MSVNKIDSTILFNKVNFFELDDVLSKMGGSLVILKGIVFLLSALFVQNKWMLSLNKAVYERRNGAATYDDASPSEIKSTQDEIVSKCSFEGIIDLNDRVVEQDEIIKS